MRCHPSPVHPDGPGRPGAPGAPSRGPGVVVVLVAATVVVVAPCVVLVVAGTVVSTSGVGGVDDAVVVVESDGLAPAEGVGASAGRLPRNMSSAGRQDGFGSYIRLRRPTRL